MDLTHLTDKELIAKTTRDIREEKEALIRVLWDIKEIERRRLFCDEKCSSLYQYLIKVHHYAEHEAYTRIAAMRLLSELPQIEKKIKTGELNITNLTTAKEVFRKKEMNSEEKLEFLERLTKVPTREAIKIKHVALETKYEKSDQMKQVTDSKIEFRFQGSNELQNKLEELKGLKAHQFPNLSLGELIEQMADLALNEWRKSAGPTKPKETSYAQIKRQVFKAANDKCENCDGLYALETEHHIPIAKGGSNKKENLKALCRACNQRAAIKEFGQMKMDIHLN